MISKAHVFKKILTPAAVSLIAALSFMLALGVSPVQGDQVTGRAVIGTITEVGVDTVTVSTAQGDFTLKLEQDTRISAPKIRSASVVYTMKVGAESQLRNFQVLERRNPRPNMYRQVHIVHHRIWDRFGAHY